MATLAGVCVVLVLRLSGEAAWGRGKVKVGEGIIRGRLKRSQPLKPYLCWLSSQPPPPPVTIFACPLGDESIFRVSEPHRPEIRTLDHDNSSGQARQETPCRQLLGPLRISCLRAWFLWSSSEAMPHREGQQMPQWSAPWLGNGDPVEVWMGQRSFRKDLGASLP